MTLLSIASSLKSEEHIPGYIMRLAQDNGFTRIEQLFYQTELSALMHGKGKAFDTACLKFGVHLAHVKLENAVNVKQVRVCPACIAEQGYIKAKWHSLTQYHCSIHHLALIDYCDACQMPLHWNIPLLLARCSNPQCSCPLPLNPSLMSEEDHHYALDW
ncbi:hypothetical protein [Alishewanella sp. HL-SH05]|uniref:hypothetical protein n=1 Tax=Alishewanella sp. HL-SH05 TaxID=3461145 RepID=UPI004042DF8F